MKTMFRSLAARFLSPALALSLVLAGCGQDNTVSAPESARTQDPAEAARTAPRASALLTSDEEDISEPGHFTAITGPTIITEPGSYKVTADFSADPVTGDGIVVRCDNVLLFAGSRTISGPGNKLGRGIVIEDARRVFVHGGRLVTFGIGVVMSNVSDSRVSSVTIVGGDEPANPPAGIPPQIGIMAVNSAHNRISRNTLRGINLGIFVRGGGSYENLIRRNDVYAGMNGLLGICYNPAPMGGPAGPSNDRVVHNRLFRFGTGIQTSSGSTTNLFANNVIRYFNSPYEDLNGSNIFQNNVTTQIQP